MLRSLAVLSARLTPTAFKKWIHTHKYLSKIARKSFARIVSVDSSVVKVESGPLAGIKLAVSEHVSHAHISGSYELETQIAIDRILAPGFVCYDVGASIGYLSLLMARKGKHVFAFEPAPHAVAELRKQIAVNDFNNVSIIERPVSDCERMVEFGLTDNAYGSRIVDEKIRGSTLRLKTTTLDDFVMSHPAPDFIKIDVEGEEARVLKGANSLLISKSPLICCELHSEQGARDVESILKEHGYSITTLGGAPFRISGPIVPGDLQVIAFPK